MKWRRLQRSLLPIVDLSQDAPMTDFLSLYQNLGWTLSALVLLLILQIGLMVLG